ncbi:hypothetical protein HMPREF1040_1064 [Megasphaera sp. UPII 135-E]|uniref:Uncharacterized protein n=1 Tax=Megasphaera hutchinsoni TaxID=1588748 RepID=A0A134CFC1_9FIRM|nr:hypothetical protein HMPREF1040_1064 [Megasphaera sp. UPII 135-E]KXB90923.1 hypothetical protein HMPREF3182_01005 [Megasphaera hutchinsoni]
MLTHGIAGCIPCFFSAGLVSLVLGNERNTGVFIALRMLAYTFLFILKISIKRR